MAGSRSEDDKHSFFSDLERLCEPESETEYDLYEHQPTHTNPNSDVMAKSYKSLHLKPTKERTAKKSTSNSYAAVVTNLSRTDECSSPKALPQINATPANNLRMKRASSSRAESGSAKGKKKVKDGVDSAPDQEKIFQGFVFFFVPNDDVAKPRNMRIQSARKHGAAWARAFDDSVTHVIIEPHIQYEEATKAFPNRQIPADVILVRTTWLGESLSCMYVRDPLQSRFRVEGAPPLPAPKVPARHSSSEERQYDKTPGNSRMNPEKSICSSNMPISEIDRNASELQAAELSSSSSDLEEAELFSAISERNVRNDPLSGDDSVSKASSRKSHGFQCMESHTGKDNGNPNNRTIDVLQEMATYYDRTGDHWRTTAYRQAITALRKQTTLIATREEALSIPQIGSRLADKVEEIVATNRLRRLEDTKDDPHAKVLALFMGIYGVGLKQALQWIAQGHRTLTDLIEGAKLSGNQRVGIAHYDDFVRRIPRAEVAEHAAVVQTACRSADRELHVTIGGSYRRGSADSGDIDLLITKPDADLSQIRNLFTSVVIPSLTESGFLKYALASSRPESGSGSKWHGASCLHGSTVWRRIDFLFVPCDELGAALLYFTGNDIFNRSMRLLASKKGMRLNQHGLYKDVMRDEGRKRVTQGALIEGRSEERIFEILGVPWKEPCERNC